MSPSSPIATKHLSISLPRCVWPAGAELGESPLWSPSLQSLYWTDILACKLHRFTPESGAQRTWQFDENICALAGREGGGLIVTLRSGFALFDPASGEITKLHNPEPDLPGNRFNDGKCDATGSFWAGSMDFACQAPSGSLYRYEPNGQCTKIDSGYAVSNGPAFSMDGQTLYHTDTKAGLIYAFDLEALTGVVSNRHTFAHFDTAQGRPDGMTTDSEDRLWVALLGSGQVVRLDQQGKIEACISLPCQQVTSCCFGGKHLDTLYITTARVGLDEAQLAAQPLAGGLFAVKVKNVSGLPPARFAG